MKVLTIGQSEEWNQLVKSFRNWDVYYLCEYATSLMVHGDGTPLLLWFEDTSSRMCYVVMRKDIAQDPKFSGLSMDTYFDFETPYGYGGPLCDSLIPVESQKRFYMELTAYCRKHGVVAQFMRYHPVLRNQECFLSAVENRYMRDTIYIDTSSPERITANMDSKSRNMVRKAIKYGVQIEVHNGENYTSFLELYRSTMAQHNADAHYLFSESYFMYLKTNMNLNSMFLYAKLDGVIASGALLLYNDRFMHYHLAGSDFRYRNFAAGNLIPYQAALWASSRGISKLHLGGGMSLDDSLFDFKKQFNKQGRLPFYVGRTIFNLEAYDALRSFRKAKDDSFDADNSFMIQYRR